MILRIHYFLILATLSVFLTGVKAQSGVIINTLEPSYYNDFSQQETSITNLCFQNVFQDNEGRLIVNNCGLQRILNSVGFFQFDGYRFWPIELLDDSSSLIKLPFLLGIQQNGIFYGLANDSKLLLFNPNNKKSQVITPLDSLRNEVHIQGINEYKGSFFVIGKNKKGNTYILKTKDGYPEESWLLKQKLTYSTMELGAPMNITDDEIWTLGQTLPLIRINRNNKTIRYYGLEDFAHPRPDPTAFQRPKLQPRIITNTDKEIILFLPEQAKNHFFRLDRKLDRFVKIEGVISTYGEPHGIFKDKIGNICFLFSDREGHYRSLLQDTLGQFFDYSAVFSRQEEIKILKGENFFKEVLVIDNFGLTIIGIKNNIDITQCLKNKWISSIASLEDKKFLVNTVGDGWFELDGQSGNFEAFGDSLFVGDRNPFSKGMVQQLIPDNKGNIWFSRLKWIVRYNPENRSSTVYDLGEKIRLFGFVKENLLVAQTSTDTISFFNLDTRQYETFKGNKKTNLNSFIRDLFTDSKGNLWIPTNNGLWVINYENETSRIFGKKDGFSDIRFTCIFEDSYGKLWIGTYFGGLHIYDPKNGEIKVIDVGKGLSNNAIMSITPDVDGDLWVATEKGINIISKNGEIISCIYKEDGLTVDKFDRFDTFTSQDRKIFFGSRNGISIIDPMLVKTGIRNDKKPKIFLSEVAFYDKKSGAEVVQNSNFKQHETLVIPAEYPYLKIKFGLSSYLQSHLNKYAYKLAGIDKNWTFLGSQPEININRLPPGNYELLIKGADFKNNWTEQPVSIKIQAKDFFYKQWWFFLLCTFPFVLFGAIWARTKLLETRRLEKEVLKRTLLIEQDKMLIEEQAKDLKQLDGLKSRFFTNISHELRTPVTLITTPLENLLKKKAQEFGESTRNTLNIIFRNSLKIRKLVEELLELSSLEANKASLNEAPTNLNTFCRQLLSAYDSAAASKLIQCDFRSEIPESTYHWVDQKRLEKIINNLLSNALKFTQRNGNVTLSLTQKGNNIQISVKDTGRGIPPEDIPFIFDRYFQTNNKKIISEGGTGIGLALSSELARLMKGELTVRSQWEEGSTFNLVIPAKIAKPPIEAAENSIPENFGNGISVPEPEIIPSIAQNNNTGIKILIVEDNTDMQQLLLSLLSERYDCVVANNGAEAWELLDSEDQSVSDIELILSDIMMPIMDGYSLLSRIKKHSKWQQTPVIMLTARAAEEDKLQALRMGVDDYLLKPFSSDELWVRTSNLISNYQKRREFQQVQTTASIEPSFKEEPSFDQAWLKKVEDAAKDALEKKLKLTIPYLADQLFISERQFSRKLKSITGLTPNKYILEIKLQKARHLLENKIYSTTTEVAHVTGFSSGSYLIKVYKERFGKSPGEYF